MLRSHKDMNVLLPFGSFGNHMWQWKTHKTEDVMMAHPDAWGFPDTSRVVAANPGEPVNPFHGAQSDRNGVSEGRIDRWPMEFDDKPMV